MRPRLSPLTSLKAAFVLTLAVTVTEACRPPNANDARTALDAVEIACVFNSTVTNAEELAQICRIAEPLLPLLRKLVEQREGARRAGVRWEEGDAGAEADEAP